MSRPRRLGLFGGTFNPPHWAHVSLAAAARDQLRLDLVEMVVSASPPHREAPVVDALHRFAMTVLACDELKDVNASARELRRSGASFTVDTLEEMKDEDDTELFLILGKDSYDDLPNWHRPERIQELAHLAVVGRPGCGGIDSVRAEDRERLHRPGQRIERGTSNEGPHVFWLEFQPMPVSASRIRQEVSQGMMASGVCPAVGRYLEAHRLYRDQARPIAREKDEG